MSEDGKILHGKVDHKRIKAILFDVDGTLSNTDDQMVMRVARMLAPLSFLFSEKKPDRFARWIVMAVETPSNFIYGIADRLGLDAPFSKFMAQLSGGRSAGKSGDSHFYIVARVKEMLERLSLHYPMGIVSARDADSTQRFLEHFGLIEFFEVVVSAQTCEHTKPFPDPIIFAAKQLDVNPEACLMVGDTVVDIRAGKSAGAQTAAVLCGFGTYRELKRAGANLILSTTPDVADLLLDETIPDSVG